MFENYIGIFISFVFAAFVACLFVFLTSILGPKKPNPAKNQPFETGKTPFEMPTGRHSVKFYLAGMLFVLFDIELIFFFPWAVLYRKLGVFGFVEMMVFLAILLVGFVYAWRKGAFEFK